MKKYARFLGLVTLLVMMLAVYVGIGVVSAQSVCSPATPISVPFAKDGAGDFCYQASSLCGYINSWNLTTLEVNGTAYTNVYVAASSIAPLNGVYTIHYVSSVGWGHFEIGGTCGGGNPTLTPTRTNTLTPVSTACDTPGSCTPTRTPTGCSPVIVVTSTPSPTMTPTPRVATATTTPSCGPIYITATPTPMVAGDLGYGTVSGTVTDANSGAPIAGALVSCSHTSYNSYPHCTGTTTTASNGTYSFTNVFFHDTDQITVSVDAAGYDSQSIVKSFFTTPGMTANFALVPSGAITPTPTATRTPTATSCIPPTQIPMSVAPVTSPTSATTQVIVVTLPSSGYTVTVVSEAGSFVQTVSSGGVYNVTIDLVPNSANHLQVQVPVNYGGGCSYLLTKNTDSNGNFLTIEQTSGGVTNTPTPTPTRTSTPSPTPTSYGNITCSPVNATISAPFTKDGAGTLCWQSSNLGSYINSWNTSSVTLNGVDITNTYVASGSYPSKVAGYWYVVYNSSVAWGHFEAK